jgi:hypothetical protein
MTWSLIYHVAGTVPEYAILQLVGRNVAIISEPGTLFRSDPVPGKDPATLREYGRRRQETIPPSRDSTPDLLLEFAL